MKNKNVKISKDKNLSFSKTIEKINFFFELITKTIIWVERYKTNDIINSSEFNICIKNLQTSYDKLKKINEQILKNNKVCQDDIFLLQKINDELSMVFKTFGTKKIYDVLSVCYGTNYYNNLKNIAYSNIDEELNSNVSEELNYRTKFDLIMKYSHPINYKVLQWKSEPKKVNTRDKIIKNKIIEDFMIVEMASTLDCFDLCRTSNNFFVKTYGIKVVFQNKEKKNTIILNCIVDDILLDCLNSDYIRNRKKVFSDNAPNDQDFKSPAFKKYVNHLTLKEWFIYNDTELYNRFIGYTNQAYLIKQKTISQVVKEFINAELFEQRKTLILLLLQEDNNEFQYLAYLLYDLLSNENNGNIDTYEQTLLYDSLPWEIKNSFRNAMKNTIKYTKNLSNFETSKIPIEQQICLLKASDAIKEKAMIKLKEVKAKSEDSGSKARQYLEGLLKIPFGIYKKENVLKLTSENSSDICKINKYLKAKNIELLWEDKEKYTNIEITNILNDIDEKINQTINEKNISNIINSYCHGKKLNLTSNVCIMNSILKKLKIKQKKLCHSGKKNSFIKKQIKNTIEKQKTNKEFIVELCKHNKKTKIVDNEKLLSLSSDILGRKDKINKNIKSINDTLEASIYGHTDAKRQLERIIGQWITGKQGGYCFGFEGPPGVGKTSLAKKGLAQCLKDEDGNPRPFSFIALGGSSNGSTLSGHNYTYVGSTWGRIVDILMEKKCMNPIIFIDELDKVSRTEHGKEIIGILTHLIDPTQNMAFQDKYFNGVDLDMSKVLFIFSYNDVSVIDRILLDRIHRIKFDYLTIIDKVEIVKNFLLPEIYENMGVENIIDFSDDVIMYLIDNYTNEAGVRKLKEILFEIVSEINLHILKETETFTFPIKITLDDIDNKYLKNRHKINRTKIHSIPKIGVINGLWANSLGLGGVIPIQAFHYPSNNFLELKLTGMQGDVMKESMNVAKTMAWNLTKPKWKKAFLIDDNKEKGLHIHCPEGAVPKDGPSAGTAITIAIYSLLNHEKIRNDVAITGEINLQGMVTEIGGLDLKILGGLKAGVKTFIYPESNKKDFNKFLEKYSSIDISAIDFYPVSKIEEVMKIVFV